MSRIDHGTQFGLLGFVNPTVPLRLTDRLLTLSPRGVARLTGIIGAGIASWPLLAAEQLLHGRSIARTEFDEPPIFILGHWRSGTTHLHNLLSHDPQFGCVRMFESVAPGCSLLTKSWLPTVLSKVMPPKRPMDNMEWPMEAPQEEEIPLAKLTPYSWYLQYLFPRSAVTTFEKYVLLEGAPDGARAEVMGCLRRILQIASLHEGGKRLLLKNPVNTARIPMLLEMFPDARFVFLHRSPYDVFQSSKNLHRKILELTSLQQYDEKIIESNVLQIYSLLMERYLQDREQIAPDRLIEIGFADLELNPLEVVERIYSQLGLPGYDSAISSIEAYAQTLGGYKKNQFADLSPREIELVQGNWQEPLRQWCYESTGTFSQSQSPASFSGLNRTPIVARQAV